ncbi:MAG: methylthioribulose 1-phosphate dehydratase [Alphaproteobacteria bacterium]|nr:methylthioribulose 1-phosphate dehydratase [Alphaproteobacteria bacterium]
MEFTFEQASEHIIKAGNRLDTLQLAPATSGNYSMRIANDEMAITVSGAHKGMLKSEEIMRAQLDGKPIDKKNPSAETLLHCILYEMFPDTRAILHTHSVPNTVLTRFLKNENHITLSGYEMLKAYPGIDTHDTSVHLPIFDNTQDMEALSRDVKAVLEERPDLPAFLIRGHGIYGWGCGMDEALRVIEATEMMLACEMHSRQMA